jgi:hypothetical protein
MKGWAEKGGMEWSGQDCSDDMWSRVERRGEERRERKEGRKKEIFGIREPDLLMLIRKVELQMGIKWGPRIKWSRTLSRR